MTTQQNTFTVHRHCTRRLMLLPLMLLMLLCSGVVTARAADDGITGIRHSALATLQYHPQLKARQFASDAAKQDLRSARGGFFPRLDVSGGYGAEAHSDPTSRRNSDDNHYTGRFDSTITASQLLYDGLATSSRVDVADAAMRSAKSQFFDTAESLALDGIIAHLNVFRQRRLVELAEDNVSQHEEILVSMEERLRLGGGSLADVTQTRGRLARAMTTLSQSSSELQVAKANYTRLTGSAPETLEEGASPEKTPVTIDTAVAATLDGNYQIAALQNELEAATAREGVSRSAFHPTFNLEASSTYTDDADSATWHTINNQVMVRMNWNLLRGGSDLATLRATKSRKHQARMDLADTQDALREEVVATWSQYQSAIEQTALFEEAVEFNRQTRDMYIQQFNVGQRSLLDVLDAENELFNTQGQLVTATTNVVIGAYRLLALEGVLLETLNIAEDELHPKSPAQ